MTAHTSRRSTARLLTAAAIIAATTSLAAAVNPALADARPDSHDSGSDSNSNSGGAARPERHVDPYGFHNPPVNQLERARIDQNRRDYYNQQRARQNQQAGNQQNDGEQAPTWTRVVRPDGSWYVCRPAAAQC
ncbi:hypothetical protein [Nocardia brasiliensis]|uniref:hypothetical protein n=1 Tax=Nocardia brasiliensis TaxID=37326 RepID=UPI0024551FF7|nr:hypothetical protein [Nocardia brasiliensis]